MKNIANYELNELKELLEDIPYDIVKIVFDYYHRDKIYTVEAFASKKHISTATLYRYIKKVKVRVFEKIDMLTYRQQEGLTNEQLR